jgi:RNA polymerase sigma factor (sigma-70 family)
MELERFRDGDGAYFAELMARRRNEAQARGFQRYREALEEDGSLKYEANPLAEVERDEALARIRPVLPDLSPREQEAMELLILEKRSPGEAAQIMGCTPSTVRSHLRHALVRLRTLMEGEGP